MIRRTVALHDYVHRVINRIRGEALIEANLDIGYNDILNVTLIIFFRDIQKRFEEDADTEIFDWDEALEDILSENEDVRKFMKSVLMEDDDED